MTLFHKKAPITFQRNEGLMLIFYPYGLKVNPK